MRDYELYEDGLTSVTCEGLAGNFLDYQHAEAACLLDHMAEKLIDAGPEDATKTLTEISDHIQEPGAVLLMLEGICERIRDRVGRD